RRRPLELVADRATRVRPLTGVPSPHLSIPLPIMENLTPETAKDVKPLWPLVRNEPTELEVLSVHELTPTHYAVLVAGDGTHYAGTAEKAAADPLPAHGEKLEFSHDKDGNSF